MGLSNLLTPCFGPDELGLCLGCCGWTWAWRGLHCTSSRRAPSYYLRLTSPSLHFKQTGSSLQLLLTSSPLNTVGRALLQFLLTSSPLSTVGRALLLFTTDEPFTALQADGLLLTTLIDEALPSTQLGELSHYLRLTSPSMHFKQTGSLLQFLLTSSPLSTVGRALLLFTTDEPFTALQADGLPPIIYD